MLRLKKHSVFGNHLKYHFFQEALPWYFVLVEVHPPTYAFSFTILGTWEYLWKCNITKLISVFPTSPSAPGWSGVFGSSPDLSALYSAKTWKSVIIPYEKRNKTILACYNFIFKRYCNTNAFINILLFILKIKGNII